MGKGLSLFSHNSQYEWQLFVHSFQINLFRAPYFQPESVFHCFRGCPIEEWFQIGKGRILTLW